ncbi:MAG TPA: type II secretion system inner membrane protein GspF [Gammaproteobacteria bacterium]|jgi:general secretion pathway protein F|nr:type II secretion system inner membrane protein GspF [Gammaproteobacteria bacterium]
MGAFVYIALDPKGNEQKGVLEGDTPRQVRQQLREQGLTPLEVSEAAARESNTPRAFGIGRGISASDLALITRQLATLVRSALPVEEALLAASEQSEKPRLKSMLLAVRARVMEGHTLAQGLSQFPHVFPEIFRATVAAGEHTGHLDGVLERLADYAETRQQLRQKIGLAMLYPMILTVVALSIVTLLMMYVVPKITAVYIQSHKALPLLTQILIWISDTLRQDGIYLLILLIAAGFALSYLFKNPEVQKRWDGRKLKLPLMGRLVRGLNTARFTRTLSILAGSGVPVLEALRISGEVVENIPMREAVADATLRVREGSAISQALGRSRLFPPITVHLIASGETSGQLSQMLERAAQHQERELEALTARLVGVFEPVLILLMGGLVMLIVLGVLLPIFDMNTMVH